MERKGEYIFKGLGLVILLAAVVALFDLRLARDLLSQARWDLLLLSLVLATLIIWLRAYQFLLLINWERKILGMEDSLRICLVGLAMGLVFPGGSGVLAKSYYGYKKTGFKEEMIAISIGDRVLSLFSLLLLGILSSLFLASWPFALGSSAGALFAGALLRRPDPLLRAVGSGRLRRWLDRHLSVARLVQFASVPLRPLAQAMGVSVAVWVLTVVQFSLFLEALGGGPPLFFLLMVYPMVVVATQLPVTIGGWGSAEVATAYFLGLAEVLPTLSVLVSLLSKVINNLLPGAAGAIYVMRLKAGARTRGAFSAKG